MIPSFILRSGKRIALQKSGTEAISVQAGANESCHLDGSIEDSITKRLPMAFGPIDFVVLEFKENKFGGDVIAGMADLVSQETIRILDLVILRKDDQGEVAVQELDELSPAELQLLEPLRAEISGMITVDDIRMVGKKLGENTTTAIMLIENLWAIRLRQDVFDAGGRLVMHEYIPTEVVTEALTDLAEYD